MDHRQQGRQAESTRTCCLDLRGAELEHDVNTPKLDEALFSLEAHLFMTNRPLLAASRVPPPVSIKR